MSRIQHDSFRSKVMSADEAADALQKAGIPAAPVCAAEDLPEARHLSETGAWVRIASCTAKVV